MVNLDSAHTFGDEFRGLPRVIHDWLEHFSRETLQRATHRRSVRPLHARCFSHSPYQLPGRGLVIMCDSRNSNNAEDNMCNGAGQCWLETRNRLACAGILDKLIPGPSLAIAAATSISDVPDEIGDWICWRFLSQSVCGFRAVNDELLPGHPHPTSRQSVTHRSARQQPLNP